jgi:hypothetical protein
MQAEVARFGEEGSVRGKIQRCVWWDGGAAMTLAVQSMCQHP